MNKIAIYAVILGLVTFDANSQDSLYSKSFCDTLAGFVESGDLEVEGNEKILSDCTIFLDGHLKGKEEGLAERPGTMFKCDSGPPVFRPPVMVPPDNTKMLDSRPKPTEQKQKD